MQKFINFEIKLDYGTVSERVYEKYAEFAELFDENIFEEKVEIGNIEEINLNDINAKLNKSTKVFI